MNERQKATALIERALDERNNSEHERTSAAMQAITIINRYNLLGTETRAGGQQTPLHTVGSIIDKVGNIVDRVTDPDLVDGARTVVDAVTRRTGKGSKRRRRYRGR